MDEYSKSALERLREAGVIHREAWRVFHFFGSDRPKNWFELSERTDRISILPYDQRARVRDILAGWYGISDPQGD